MKEVKNITIRKKSYRNRKKERGREEGERGGWIKK